MLQDVHAQRPAAHDIWLQKLQLEDERFSLLRPLAPQPRRSQRRSRPSSTMAMSPKASRLELDERQHRLENHPACPGRRKGRGTAEDRRNQDSLIDDQYTKTVTTGPDFSLRRGLPEGVRPGRHVREATVDVPTTAPGYEVTNMTSLKQRHPEVCSGWRLLLSYKPRAGVSMPRQRNLRSLQ